MPMQLNLFNVKTTAAKAFFASRRVRYIAGVTTVFLVLFLVLRGIFYFGFSEAVYSSSIDLKTLLSALYLGVKFDLRLAILIALPVFALASIPTFNLVSNRTVRLLCSCYLLLAAFVVLGFYIVDFGHYAYLGTRVDSQIMRFAGNADVSMRMVWQSYPVVWILLGWISAVILVACLNGVVSQSTVASVKSLMSPYQPTKKWQVGLGMFLVLNVMLSLMFGRVSSVPLRWNHAFFNADTKIAALGLNPVLFFFDTYSNSETGYDEQAVRHYYPLIANYLGVKNLDIESLNYDRHHQDKTHAVVSPGERKPNIIFIMLESLGASRVGIYGNPLKPTPNIDALAAHGIWASNFYVPVSGTARTVFASITGIPDVSTVKTASRNPLITDQRVVLNAFSGYEKYYFIGGSAGWANMSAFINNSVKGLHLFEEKSYSAPAVDVWGISDLRLFKEFDAVVSQRDSDQPFVAILQTAGNHRPFTIPDDNDGFEVKEMEKESLRKWGFKSAEQFNAVRLLDFNIGRLMEIAKASGYYENSIFILYGDHNNRITQTPHMDKFYEKVKLDLDGVHVPFIIHAPKYLQPRKLEEAISLVDVMPTAAALVGIDYTNTTMGRNIFAAPAEGERSVYVQGKEGNRNSIGLINKSFALRMLDDGSVPSLHKLHSETPGKDVQTLYPEKFLAMSNLLRGFYETSKFQLYHNRRSAAEKRRLPQNIETANFDDYQVP